MNPCRRFHLWIALWLAVVLPITAFGQSLAGNFVSRSGQLSPVNGQSPAQSSHEEDESHSPAKLETTKALGRRLRYVSLARRISVLPTLAVSQEERRVPGVNRSDAPSPPTPLFRNGALSHRGPPSA